jgi:hypothetical protein
MRSDIVSGGILPDYELPHTRTTCGGSASCRATTR